RRNLEIGAHVEARPIALTVGSAQQVALAPKKSRKAREAAAAGTGFGDLGIVRHVIADEGAREIREVCEHEAAGLSRPAGIALLVQHLGEMGLGHDVIEAALGALRGDDTISPDE